MTIEEIRKGAPEGATHYDDSGDYWRVIDDLDSYFTDGDKWVRHAFPCYVDIKNGFIKPL